MSNIFKSNSRFAALAEETSNKKVFNKKKSEEIEKKTVSSNNEINLLKKENVSDYTSFKFDNIKQRNCYTNRFSKEENEKIKQKNLEKDMAPENFPDLVKVEKITSSSQNKMSFTKVLTKNILKQNITKKEEEIPSNWCILKRDKNSGKIITKYGKCAYIEIKKINLIPDIDILNSFVELHEKRTNEYIELYGYDTWEKIFTFQNYDYGWVDRLDEEYDEEMITLEQDNEEYDYNEDSNY